MVICVFGKGHEGWNDVRQVPNDVFPRDGVEGIVGVQEDEPADDFVAQLGPHGDFLDTLTDGDAKLPFFAEVLVEIARTPGIK